MREKKRERERERGDEGEGGVAKVREIEQLMTSLYAFEQAFDF